jgi:hypothetical protein
MSERLSETFWIYGIHALPYSCESPSSLQSGRSLSVACGVRCSKLRPVIVPSLRFAVSGVVNRV